MSDTTAITPSPARWFFGIFAAFAVFAVVGVYSFRMADNTPSYDDDQGQERYAKLSKLQADDHKTLTTAGWIDQDKGTVRIPIDEAMTEEVDTLKARQVQMGSVIPGTAAPPAVANTLPATNTPPADGAPPAPATAGKNASSAPATNAAPTGSTPTPPAPNQ